MLNVGYSSHKRTLLAVGLFAALPNVLLADDNRTSAKVDEQMSSKLDEVLLPLIKRHRGDTGVMIKHLPSGETFAYRENTPMPTASLIKLPVMMAAYQAVDSGKTDLGKMLPLRKSDMVPGSGVLTNHFSPGTKLSLRDAIQLMIAFSDNTATNLVVDEIGLNATNELMAKLNCGETRLNAKVYRRDTSNDIKRSQKYGLGSTTAFDMIQLLETLHRKDFLNNAYSEQILAHLYSCKDRTKVPRLLPPEIKVAHKTGSVSDVRTDAGFIDSPTGTIAYCVLTAANEDRSWSDSNEAELLAAEIGLAAFEHFAGDTPVAPPVARELKIGSQGDLVEALQRTLNARVKPTPGISSDGDFGPNTEAAVIAFQKQENLPPNGVVDRVVWKSLGPLIMEDVAVPDPELANAETAQKQPIEALDGPPLVTCKAWIFVDGESGERLAGQNEHVVRDPASTTKLMTAYVVLKHAQENPGVLDQIVTFSPRADETSGSTAGVKAGEMLTAGELLYGLMLPSGNDASVALAEHFGDQLAPEVEGPSYDKFVTLMNRTASSLGMNDTGYRNPHGLTEEGHNTTAADMAVLAHSAMSLAEMRTIVRTRRLGTTVNSTAGYQRNLLWKTTNRLLDIEGYTGIKTGTTGPAGACLIGSAERDGREVIGVVLGSSSSAARYTDFRNLYRWLWNNRIHTDANQASPN